MAGRPGDLALTGKTAADRSRPDDRPSDYQEPLLSQRRHAPAVRLTGLAAGFHAVTHLPPGAAEQDVIRAARSRSVGLYGMSTYRADHHPDPPQLVLGFGNTGQRAIREGIATRA